MAAPRIFRLNMLTACASCGAEWFGPGGEAAARAHASTTGHQVDVQILHRETINPAAADVLPQYPPQAELSAEELHLSRRAARERVTLFEQPLMQRGSSR